jgi:hypothetical protein
VYHDNVVSHQGGKRLGVGVPHSVQPGLPRGPDAGL